MKVTINGKILELEAPMPLAALLARLGLEGRPIAVEKNREVVRRGKYGESIVADGDALEIVHFVGGG